MWLPAIKALAAERDWRIVALIKPSCTFVELTVWSGELKRPFTECDQWRALALAKIAADRPDIIFVAGTLNYRLATPSGAAPYTPSAWQTAMAASLAHLKSISDRVVMFAETPHHEVVPAHCLATHQLVQECETSRAKLVDSVYARIEEIAAKQAGITLLPVISWLCQGSNCSLIMDHYLVYRDGTHLTATFSYLLAPQIRWALDTQP
jgi:hypothetical protein